MDQMLYYLLVETRKLGRFQVKLIFHMFVKLIHKIHLPLKNNKMNGCLNEASA